MRSLYLIGALLCLVVVLSACTSNTAPSPQSSSNPTPSPVPTSPPPTSTLSAPSPTAAAVVTPPATVVSIPTPTSAPTPVPIPTPTPVPTSTPVPTPTPMPTPTPVPLYHDTWNSFTYAAWLDRHYPEVTALIKALPWVNDGISDEEAEALDSLKSISQQGWQLIGSLDLNQWRADDEDDLEVLHILNSLPDYYTLHPDVALLLLREGVPLPTVRVIYATPSDVEPNPVYMDAISAAIASVQGWYAEKLGGQTFTLADPLPEHCELPNEELHYAREGGYNRVVDDIQDCAPVWWHSPYYTWVVYPDVKGDCELTNLGAGADGITILHRDDMMGLSSPEGHTHCGYYRPHSGWLGGLAHEVGHALGLPHPPGCDEGLDTCDWHAMMQLGYVDYPDTYLTEMDVEMLLDSPFIRVRQ